MLYVYIVCLTFGVVYSVVSAFLGGHGWDHGGMDHAGGGGHGSADTADAPSPFNPLVIAGAIATFGAVGLIGKKGFGMTDLMSVLVSLGFAGAIGAGLFFGIVKFMYGSQSNSAFSQSDLAGKDAEVLTPVPEKGLGEIAYVANGIRYTMSAKSFYGEQIRRGETVRIKEVANNTALVARKMTLEDLELSDEDRERRPQAGESKNNI